MTSICQPLPLCLDCLRCYSLSFIGVSMMHSFDEPRDFTCICTEPLIDVDELPRSRSRRSGPRLMQTFYDVVHDVKFWEFSMNSIFSSHNIGMIHCESGETRSQAILKLVEEIDFGFNEPGVSRLISSFLRPVDFLAIFTKNLGEHRYFIARCRPEQDLVFYRYETAFYYRGCSTFCSSEDLNCPHLGCMHLTDECQGSTILSPVFLWDSLVTLGLQGPDLAFLSITNSLSLLFNQVVEYMLLTCPELARKLMRDRKEILGLAKAHVERIQGCWDWDGTNLYCSESWDE